MSLKNLQEIANLVTNYTKKNRFVEYVDDDGDEIKYRQLIKGLANNQWENESDARFALYGNSLGIKTFEMLKSRAREHLVNQIFQLDTSKRFKSSTDKAYFSTCKNILAGAILLRQNREESGIYQLQQSLLNSRKYYFTDLTVLAIRLLRTSSSFSGSKKLFEKYNDLLKKSLKTLDAELQAEELNQELILDVVSGLGLTESWKERVAANYNKLKELCRKFDTYNTRINMYRVGIRYYDSIHDYRNAIRLATECEEYLHSNPHMIQKVRLGEMSLNKLYGSLHLRDYANGSTYAASCMTLFNPGSLNWLIFLEYHFLLCLHTGNYEEAAKIYNQVITHPAFRTYPPQNKEKWKIFEAFLMYALPVKGKPVCGFNVARFINEVPIFSKDKAGYNFSIIVAQVLLSLKIGDYSKIVDRAEALKLYASRYIRKEKNPRSYYFVKMLMVMISYDFDPKKTEQIANKFFTKLKNAHLGEQSELETLEVIPYDLLWPEILERLKSNKELN